MRLVAEKEGPNFYQERCMQSDIIVEMFKHLDEKPQIKKKKTAV